MLSLLRPTLAAFALITTFGCSGSETSHTGADDSAITAEQANAEQHKLTEHVIEGFPASRESREQLGITKWDVFSGDDLTTGFSGVVFYASDENGDVKYAFMADVAKKGSALVRMDRDGKSASVPVAEDAATKLMAEIARLQVETNRSRASSCARTVAWAGISLVLAGGAAAIVGATVYAGLTVAAGYGALAGVVGAAGGVEAVTGLVTTASSVVSFGAGYAYVAYWVTPTFERAAYDARACAAGTK